MMPVEDYFTDDIYMIEERHKIVDFVWQTFWEVIGNVKGFAEVSTSQERLIAAQRGVSKVFTIMLPKTIPLKFNDKILVFDANHETVFMQITNEPQESRGVSAKDVLSYQAESWANPPLNIEGLPK